MDAEPIVLEPRQMRCRRLRRTITEAARSHERQTDWTSLHLGRSGFRKTFITLTYRNLGEWERCHISRMVRLMRQWFKRRGESCRFVWVAELQKRGALHYHLVVWVPRRLRLPRPDLCGWWPHGSSKIETARNPIGYMVKYATKTTPDALKRLPKGVRLHGNGGHEISDRVALREKLLPGWVSERRYQRLIDVHETEAAAQLGWEMRRIALHRFEADGTVARFYVDPEYDEQARIDHWIAEAEAHEEWLAYQERWACKGYPNYLRVSGGVVDLRTGEHIPTPWQVRYEHGSLILTKKPEHA